LSAGLLPEPAEAIQNEEISCRELSFEVAVHVIWAVRIMNNLETRNQHDDFKLMNEIFERAQCAVLLLHERDESKYLVCAVNLNCISCQPDEA
jgi:hypothetical protein